MRKLKIQVQISLDGYMAGPDNELNWVTWNWDDQLNEYVGNLTENVDTILLGRKLAEGFIDYWKRIAEDPHNPENAAGKLMYETPKFVFSNTLRASPWNHTRVVNTELQPFIRELKSQVGTDIIAYGGASFLHSLIETDLIDEYHILINPTAIAHGKALFPAWKALQLIKSSQFPCGITALQLAPVQEQAIPQ